MDSKKQKECLVCFNNTEKCITFPLEESDKILNNLLTYLDPTVAIKPVFNNDQLFFCNHCFDFTSQLNKLEDRLEVLQNRISNLSSTFSRAIVFRRKLLAHRKKEIPNKNDIGKVVAKKSTAAAQNVFKMSLPSCSSNPPRKFTKIFVVVPKAKSNVINENQHENNKETDSSLANQEMNIVISSNNVLVKSESVTNDCGQTDNENMDIFIHKNSSQPNNSEIDIENVKCESMDESGVLDTDNEENITDLQENQANFPPVAKNGSGINLKDPEVIDLSDDDDEITVLSGNSDDFESSETESGQPPIILPGTVRQLNDTTDGDDAEKANEVEKPDTTGDNPANKPDSDDDSLSFEQSNLSKIIEAKHVNKDKPFICLTCNQGFAKNSALKDHRTIHTGEKPYKCKYCDRRFRMNGMKTKHEKTHLCTFCNKPFAGKEQLELHKKTHTSEYKCSFCEKTFIGTHSLKLHERTHKGEQNFECSNCDEIFINAFKLKEHERIHTGERPFQCSFCPKRLITIESLIFHEKTHTREPEGD